MSDFPELLDVPDKNRINGATFSAIFKDLKSRNLKDGKHIRFQDAKGLYLHKDGASVWHIVYDFIMRTDKFSQLRLKKQRAAGDPFFNAIKNEYGQTIADDMFKNVLHWQASADDQASATALSDADRSTDVEHAVQITWGDVQRIESELSTRTRLSEIKVPLSQVPDLYGARQSPDTTGAEQTALNAAANTQQRDQPQISVNKLKSQITDLDDAKRDADDVSQSLKTGTRPLSASARIWLNHVPAKFMTLIDDHFDLLADRKFFDKMIESIPSEHRNEFRFLIALICYEKSQSDSLFLGDWFKAFCVALNYTEAQILGRAEPQIKAFSGQLFPYEARWGIPELSRSGNKQAAKTANRWLTDRIIMEFVPGFQKTTKYALSSKHLEHDKFSTEANRKPKDQFDALTAYQFSGATILEAVDAMATVSGERSAKLQEVVTAAFRSQ